MLNYTRKQPAMPHLPSCKPPLDRNVYTKLRGLLVVSDASWKTDEASYAGVIIFFAGCAVDWCSDERASMQPTRDAAAARAAEMAPRPRVFLGGALGSGDAG